MPTYVYECPRCGRFEEQQSISATARERCPNCGDEVRRVIVGGTSIILKGRRRQARTGDQSTPCCGRETRCDRPPCRD